MEREGEEDLDKDGWTHSCGTRAEPPREIHIPADLQGPHDTFMVQEDRYIINTKLRDKLDNAVIIGFEGHARRGNYDMITSLLPGKE